MANDETALNTVNVFFSYSHRDEALRNELALHLTALARSGKIQAWHDRMIAGGEEWKGVINTRLQQAEIILLLVSPDFLASEYCYDVEMSLAIERHRRGDAVVIPVILRPVDFAGTPLADLQALPNDAKPVTTWPNLDLAFKNVAEGIRRIVDARLEKQFSQYQIQTGTDWIPQLRALDTAIAPEWPIGDSREVIAMIRLSNSEGLKLLLDQSWIDHRLINSATKNDVVSTPFSFGFTFSSKPVSVPTLTCRVTAPDFLPAERTKRVPLPKLSDSDAYMFLFRAEREGIHLVNVELLCEDVTVAEHLRKTRVVQPYRSPGGSTISDEAIVLASVPLKVMCVAKSASTAR